jgi:hypothetical protein
LNAELRPRFRLLSENAGQFTISGVIGTVSLGPGKVLQVTPKTSPNEDWIAAVLDLLIGSDRIDAAGERTAGLSPNRRSLLEVLAAIYAARLKRAIRRDGPLLLIERTEADLPHLKGRLQATPWIRHAAWRPHRLPVSFDRLTPNNDFSRALSAVALILADVTQSVQTRNALLEAARTLRPGFPQWAPVTLGVATRRLPPQWSVYQPAWSIAAAILARRSLLRRRGVYQGVSIVIEAWPLLERLLERALSKAVQIARLAGRDLSVSPKQSKTLLTPLVGLGAQEHCVIPDGRLLDGRATVATFEAKYKAPDGAQPDRADIYQALCAAATHESPLAVLIYPESFPPAWWRVEGFAGRPSHFAAVGLGLFSYRHGTGDFERGETILKLLNGPPVSTGQPQLLEIAP